MKIEAAQRLLASDEVEVSFTVKGEAAKTIPELLWALHCLGSLGCSRDITIRAYGRDEENVSFAFDGDGSDRLDNLKVNGAIYKPEE